jgi:2-iminoacetate synthase ThiH
MRRFTVVCEDSLADEVESIAREYDVTEEEVLRQLVEAGLEAVQEPEPP